MKVLGQPVPDPAASAPAVDDPQPLLVRLRFVAGLLRELPEPPPGPCLVWRDAVGQVVIRPLAGTTTIGRDPASTLVLTDPTISRRHCRIELEGDDATLIDQGSRNGTRVNGSTVARRALADGDVIQLGRHHLVFLRRQRFAFAA